MKKIITMIMVVTLLSVILAGCSSEPDVERIEVGGSTTEGVEPSDEVDDSEPAVEEDTQPEPTEEPDVEEEAEETSEESELALPDFLPDGRGNDIAFSDFEGKMLFVNFFGTWCTYCMQEMPDFQRFTEAYGDQATIVIVNALETESISMEEVVEWYDDNGYTMPMVFDEDKSKTLDYYGAIQGFPTKFVFDENQNFLGYIPGMMEYSMLEEIMATYSGQ